MTSVHASGHNKWSKIKTRKGAQDRQKSLVYAKANRDIMVAVRNGGSPDPEVNAALATILKKAKASGVPKDNIEKALAKASGGQKGSQHVTYEAMATGSVGVLVECLTDNSNRTLKFLREILSSHGARLAPVAYLFQRRGYVRVAVDNTDDVEQRIERLIETALEASAEDFENVESTGDTAEVEFTCPPQALAKLTTAVTAPGLARELLASELIYAPLEESAPLDETTEEGLSELVEALEENEDTLRVWTTLDS